LEGDYVTYLKVARDFRLLAIGGVQEALGTIIVFTDDDVSIPEDWIENISTIFDTYDCDAIGGRVLPLYPENTSEWIKKNQDLISGPIVRHDYGDNIKPYETLSMFPFCRCQYGF